MTATRVARAFSRIALVRAEVNKPENDDPWIIEPIEPATAA
jgi:hypothetical protein